MGVAGGHRARDPSHSSPEGRVGLTAEKSLVLLASCERPAAA